MSHAAFSNNLHLLSSNQQRSAAIGTPRGILAWALNQAALLPGKLAEVQDPAVQQTFEKLWAVASHLLEEEGEHARLEFFVRTSEGRFHIQSFPGEPVKDLLARIAYLALMPDHAGLETASVRKVRGGNSCGNGSTCSGTTGLKCSSSKSTRASNTGSIIRRSTNSTNSTNSSVVTDSDFDSNAHTVTYSEDKLVVRFSEHVEQIFFGVEQRGKNKTPKRDRLLQADPAPHPYPTLPSYAAPTFF